ILQDAVASELPYAAREKLVGRDRNPALGSGLFLFILRTVTGVLCPVLEVAAGQFWNSFPLKISKG
ncbi:hypothetical protein, partial [Bilophila wadsworthia]|uniref:hypothetical protein n=1 Tax=Bilophila wadsworthia TaxID=35833 RepID=UPI0032BF6EDF